MHSCFLTTWLWNRGEFCWWVILIWWEHCNGLLETFRLGRSCHFSPYVVERTNISKHPKTISYHTWKCCCKCRSCGYYMHWNQFESMLKFPAAIIGLQHHSYKQQNPHKTTTYHSQPTWLDYFCGGVFKKPCMVHENAKPNKKSFSSPLSYLQGATSVGV